ncbi:hypothetical protein BT96DRAFT_646919 [Gymnopus androsaceus JB14]|uniref:F-box domain-containing protein n=1 Tax=Gymnopus androsaceus JB14 TaxID=1447944 RepID=A0A6A4HQU7_9AGAR|nr:hypothetical protein BT96DRAFT_646919 [Gymnopus androsaceus JB14]
MSSEGKLSQDLIERIIDLLSDDYKTLRKCALVCADWRTRSQYLLFKYLELVFVDSSESYVQNDSISQNRDRKGEKFDGFIHRLQTTILANPSIVDKVRDLLVEFKPKMTRRSVEEFGVDAEMPLTLPFTKLESLYMRYSEGFGDYHFQIHRIKRLSLFLQSNPSLRRIVIDPIALNESSVEFLTALQSLPDLQDLAWDGAWTSANGLCPILPLKRLCWYSHVPSSDLGSDLVKLPQLEELVILYSSRHLRAEATRVLRACTASLKHLTILLEEFIRCPTDILTQMIHLTHLQLLDPCCQMLQVRLAGNCPLGYKISELSSLHSLLIVFPPEIQTILTRPAPSWADRALSTVPEIAVYVWDIDNISGRVQIDLETLKLVFPLTSQLGLLKDMRPFWWPSTFWNKITDRAALLSLLLQYVPHGGDYDGDTAHIVWMEM